jgi:hypothetical protein
VEIEDLRSAMEAAGHTTRFQVQDHVWTAELVRAALTGEDTLGLGGALFGQNFMLKLCTLPTVIPPEETLPQPPVATGTPPVEIPSQPTKAVIIPLLTPPIAIPSLPRKLPILKGDLLPDQGSPALPYPPTLSVVPTTEAICQMGPEEYITPQRMDTPIPDSLFRAGTPIDA